MADGRSRAPPEVSEDVTEDVEIGYATSNFSSQSAQDEDDDGVEDGEDDGEEDALPGGESQTESPDRATASPLPQPGLKDISSLASWTVSSSKPGCGIQALRHPSTSFFWQSDGPQPHVISVHFPRMVAIAHARLHVDFDLDESYTPVKLAMWAGTGHHDLQLVSTMELDHPRGWLSVDLSNVGGEEEDGDGEPVLRCMLVQVRVLENFQNGKDTHLRGLQLFSKDGDRRTSRMGAEDNMEVLQAVRGGKVRKKAGTAEDIMRGLPRSSWMEDPEIR